MSNLENSFKDAFTDFDEISPSAGLWNRISTTLLLKSAGFKILVVSFIALLMVGLPSYFYFSETNSTQGKALSLNTTTIQSKSLTQSETNTSINKATPESTIENKASSSTKKESSEQALIIKKNANAHQAIESSAIVENQQNSSIKPRNHSSKTNKAQTKTKSNTPLVAATYAANSQITNNQTSEDLNTKANYDIYPDNEYVDTKINNSSNIEQIPRVKPLDIYSNSIVELENNDEFKVLPISQNRLKYHNELEVFAGPNIAFNMMKTNDKNYESIIDLRKTNESPKLSYHFGLNYKSYYYKWFVSMGVNYHRIEDRASYTVTAFDVDSAISSYMIFNTTYNKVIVGYIPNPNDTNSNIPVYDIIVNQDTTTVHNTFYDSTETTKAISFTNSYSYIEIPLSIGREFNYRNFVIDISGGISYGRLIKSVVNIPNESGTALLSSQEVESMIVKNTYSGILSLGLAYRINEGSLLFIRPEIRYNLNSLFEKEYPINQKYIQIRTSIGMRIKL